MECHVDMSLSSQVCVKTQISHSEYMDAKLQPVQTQEGEEQALLSFRYASILRSQKLLRCYFPWPLLFSCVRQWLNWQGLSPDCRPTQLISEPRSSSWDWEDSHPRKIRTNSKNLNMLLNPNCHPMLFSQNLLLSLWKYLINVTDKSPQYNSALINDLFPMLFKTCHIPVSVLWRKKTCNCFKKSKCSVVERVYRRIFRECG